MDSDENDEIANYSDLAPRPPFSEWIKQWISKVPTVSPIMYVL